MGQGCRLQEKGEVCFLQRIMRSQIEHLEVVLGHCMHGNGKSGRGWDFWARGGGEGGGGAFTESDTVCLPENNECSQGVIEFISHFAKKSLCLFVEVRWGWGMG